MTKNSNNVDEGELKLLKQITENPNGVTSDMVNQAVKKMKSGITKKTVKFEERNGKLEEVDQVDQTLPLKSAIKTQGDGEEKKLKEKVPEIDKESGEKQEPDLVKNTDATQIVAQSDNLLSLMGFVVPKQTLYLLIACVLIAIALYYMSSKPEKENKKKKNKKSPQSEDE